LNAISTTTPVTLALVTSRNAARVDSRLLATSLHKKHKVLMELIHKYADKLRGHGHLPFQTEVGLRDKTVGIGAGQRHRLEQAPRAFLIVAQAVAAQAMRGAADHRQGYERVKLAMAPLARLSIGAPA